MSIFQHQAHTAQAPAVNRSSLRFVCNTLFLMSSILTLGHAEEKTSQLRISYDFDSASLRGARVDGDTVYLQPIAHTFNGRPTSTWNSFRVDGAKGRTLTFRFDLSGTKRLRLHAHDANNRYQMSTDGISWQPISTTRSKGKAYHFTATMGSDRVWISHHIPYPMHYVKQQVATWLTSPYVTPTPSADSAGRLLTTGGAVWMTKGGHNEAGKIIPPHPLYAVRITDPTVEAPHQAILVSGNHGGEHVANHAIDGLVAWLISDDTAAQELRRMCKITIYPMINPDGRYGGYSRGNQYIPQGDHNRMWSPDDNGTLPAMDRIKQAIAEDCPGPVAFFLDIHNQHSADRQYMYANDDIAFTDPDYTAKKTKHTRLDGAPLLPFLRRMQQDIPTFTFHISTSYRVAPQNTTNKTWAKVASDGPRARYSYTMEPGCIPEQQREVAYHYGRTMGLALLDGLRQLSSPAK